MAECPVCHDIDGYVTSLLKAWKEIAELKELLKSRPERLLTVKEVVVPKDEPVIVDEDSGEAFILPPQEDPLWETKYNAIKEAYIKTRLEVSGSFGNWSGDTRRRVLENEISAELGFKL